MAEDELTFDFGAKKKKKPLASEDNSEPAPASVGDDTGKSDGGELEFDFGSKKKKKKPELVPEKNDDGTEPQGIALGGDDDGELEFDFGKKKKKKPSEGPVPSSSDESSNQKSYSVENVSETDDYSYESLCERIYTQLQEKNPNLSGGARTVVMKPPQIAREGKKSVWINFAEMCKTMGRKIEHVQSYVFAELGTTGSIDGANRLVIKGRFQPKQIETVLRHYIGEYVACRTCHSADTQLKKENRLYFMQCQVCGSKRSVAPIKKGFEAQVGRRKK